VADAVLLEDDVIDPSSLQVIAHREAGLTSADDEDASVIACSAHLRTLELETMLRG
jgi:hypothetical protein